VQALAPKFRISQPLFRGEAQYCFDPGADVAPLALRAQFGSVYNYRDLFDERAVADFGFAQGKGSLLAFVDCRAHEEAGEGEGEHK